MNRAKGYLEKGTAAMLIIAILAVSCAMPMSGPGSADRNALISAAGRAIGEHLEMVREYIDVDIDDADMMLSGLDGYDVAMRASDEEGGERYLEFCLGTLGAEDAEAVIASAEGLAPDEELDKIRATLEEAETRIWQDVTASGRFRALAPSEQEAFFGDLKTLLVKSAVVLTAAVVYAFVPDMIVWGKVVAASGVAIAAGVLSATLLSIIEFYKLDTEDNGVAFEKWLELVTTEPVAGWTLAASVISVGTAMGMSSVLTSVILGVFTLFNVVNEVKPMLEKYDFDV